MGSREQVQEEKQQTNRKKSAGRVVRRIVIPILLAAALLALGASAPGFFLNRRAGQYVNTTAQAAISDIHPYGDQYESTKESILAAIKYKIKIEDGDIDVDIDVDDYASVAVDDDDNDNDQMLSCLRLIDDFMDAWAEQISQQGYWISGLTELVYDDVVPVYEQDGEAAVYLAYGYDYSGIMDTSGILLDADTGAPVYMELYVTGWDGVQADVIWSCLLDTYQEQFGIQFTDLSNAQADEQADDMFMALSADQSLELNMEMEQDEDNEDWGSIGLMVEISAHN